MKRILGLMLSLLFCFGAGFSHAQSCTNHEIDLSWSYTQGSDLATGFYVFQEQQGQSKFNQLNATQQAVSVLTYKDCSVAGGYTYSYYITAVDSSGNQSADSNVWVSTTVPVDPVTGVQVTHNSNGSNTIVWSSSPDGGTYTVTRSSQACGTSGQTFTQIATGLTTTTDTDSNPGSGSAFCYGVTATVNSVVSTTAFGGTTVPPAAPATLTGTVAK